jgi:hypothetical protein
MKSTTASAELRASEQKFEQMSCFVTIHVDQKMDAIMPVLLWLLGVPLVVVVALMLTHVI